MNGLFRRIISKAIRPAENARVERLERSVNLGPRLEGENVTRDFILGREATTRSAFPLVPDLFVQSVVAVASGATQDILEVPIGGVHLCQVQWIFGQTPGSQISVGTNQAPFGFNTPGNPATLERGETALYYDPELNNFIPISFLPGGIFFPEGVTILQRSESGLGIEAIHLYSFAQPASQVFSHRR